MLQKASSEIPIYLNERTHGLNLFRIGLSVEISIHAPNQALNNSFVIFKPHRII